VIAWDKAGEAGVTPEPLNHVNSGLYTSGALPRLKVSPLNVRVLADCWWGYPRLLLLT